MCADTQISGERPGHHATLNFMNGVQRLQRRDTGHSHCSDPPGDQRGCGPGGLSHSLEQLALHEAPPVAEERRTQVDQLQAAQESCF